MPLTIKIPSPQDLKLPEKFEYWRANQAESIDVMITSKRRITALSAPTGFGKSPAYIAYALHSGRKTCIVTASKGLQDQLMADFAPVGLVDLRGRSNYDCVMRDDYSCEEGHTVRCPYRGSMMCPYSAAEFKCAASKLTVTNYEKWMADRGEHHPFNMMEQLILDEGHEAPDAVASRMSYTLRSDDIENDLQIPFPRHDIDNFGTWKVWASGAKYEVDKQVQQMKGMIDESDAPRIAWIKKLGHLKHLSRRLTVLALGKEDNWIVEQVEDGFKFDPIYPFVYSEGILFQHVPRIVIVSATIRPKTLALLGQKGEAYDFRDFPSEFDPERCPVYWVPTMRVDSKATDLRQLWVRLDQIAAKRQDRKGIIHTVSYARQQDIAKNSRFADHMILNQRGELITYTVQRFRGSGPGAIFVSPSISTGFDFPGKDCEWQFICKIPFPDSRAKIVKARQQVDKEYGPYLAMQTLVQAVGRAMRSKNDRAESFIPDDHLSWFMPRYAHLAPKSFHSFFKKALMLPQPPPRLED